MKIRPTAYQVPIHNDIFEPRTVFTSDQTYSISVLRKRSQHNTLSVVGYFSPSLVKLQLTVDRIYFIDTMKRFQIGF